MVDILRHFRCHELFCFLFLQMEIELLIMTGDVKNTTGTGTRVDSTQGFGLLISQREVTNSSQNMLVKMLILCGLDTESILCLTAGKG